jgi:hypothetical protein
MSLELAAQHLASRGRKGDSMLVHMAPEEVSGLQALARAGGGTLTLNPDTGLPEANFLKRMLPTLIGAGLMFATGGAAAPGLFGLSKAATIGLGLGGAETLRTGSLEKGLMAGLGAYGGAGLTGGLMGATAAKGAAAGAAGATPAMSMAPATTSPVTAALMKENLISGVTPAASSAATTAASTAPGMMKYGLAALSPGMQEGPQKPFDGGGPNPYEFEYDPRTQTYTRVPVGTRQRDILAPTTQMAADGGMMSSGPLEALSDRNRIDTMMANGGQMFADGGQVNLQGTFTAGDQGGGGPFGQANANGYQAAGSGGPIQGFSSAFGQMGGGKSNQIFSGGFGTPGGIDPRAVQADPQGFQRWMQGAQQQEQQMPGSTMMGRPQGGYNPFAGGQDDISSLLHVLRPDQKGANNAGIPSNQMMMRDAQYRPERDDARIAANQTNSNFASYAAGGIASMAQGGPSHLGDYSDGGRLLKGPGDGVSDSIPATIANKRPARLADGEFVVPARIVSELGNGSTEAGARKLYAMMDRVQKARGKTTGKNRVAVNSRAEKLLPA